MPPRLRPFTPLVPAALVLLLARMPAARGVVPALGLFTGPLGGVLLAVALLVALRRVFPQTPRVAAPGWLLFALSATFATGFGLHYTRTVEPSGDEIDYLLMAQSVWREGDLDLRDNFARGDFREYMGGLAKMPGGVRDRFGRHRPTHSGGFAVLLAPAYALGGRSGCVVWIALLTSLLALVVRDMALRLTGDPRAALAAWAACVGPPILFYEAFLYTEPVLALCLAVALRTLLWPGRRAWVGAVIAALALSALPWLHVRMALAAVALGGFALFRLRGTARWAFVLTAGTMAAVYALYQVWAFGTLSPFARYGTVPAPVTGATPLRTLVGLWVDGAYGLLPYAPFFLLAPLGLLLVARGLVASAPLGAQASAPRRAVAWALLCTFLSVLLPVLGWRNWWGFSPPGRFTIPFVPVFALAIAMRLAAFPERGLARWRWPLFAAGIGFALFLFADPHAMRMVGGRDGTSQGFDALAGSVSFSRYLPFLSSRLGSVAAPWEPPAAEARVAAVWLGALLILFALDLVACRNGRIDRWFAGLALPLALLLVTAITVDAVRRTSRNPAAERVSDPAAMGLPKRGT